MKFGLRINGESLKLDMARNIHHSLKMCSKNSRLLRCSYLLSRDEFEVIFGGESYKIVNDSYKILFKGEFIPIQNDFHLPQYFKLHFMLRVRCFF